MRSKGGRSMGESDQAGADIGEPKLGKHMSTKQNRIGIMVVDGQEVVRQGVKALVTAEQDMDIVAETGRADEIVPLYADSRPDLVIMDLRLRNGSGLDAIRQLRVRFPASRIVVLSNDCGEEHVFRAIEAGAKGYVMKDS